MKICLKVNIAQFRRNFLQTLHVKKSKALRQHLLIKTKAKQNTFKINFMNEDSSEGRKVSHHRLKVKWWILLDWKPVYKIDYSNWKSYDLTLSQNLKKSVLIADKLENEESMPYADKLARSQSSETSCWCHTIHFYRHQPTINFYRHRQTIHRQGWGWAFYFHFCCYFQVKKTCSKEKRQG